ncbi:MAG: hypothetical protein ACJAVI_004800 [Candidatus Azotimanducaceae bacterium]
MIEFEREIHKVNVTPCKGVLDINGWMKQNRAKHKSDGVQIESPDTGR